MDLGPEGARRELGVVRDRGHRHDGIAFDPDDGARHALRHRRAPLALHAQVADIAHQQRGVFREFRNDILRRAQADAEADAARGEKLFGLAQALEHELVVPPVGLGKRRQRKRDDDGQVQGVGLFDGEFQRGIETSALRLLHPVEHVFSPCRRAGIQAVDARFVNHDPSRYSFGGLGANRLPPCGGSRLMPGRGGSRPEMAKKA